MAGGLGITAGAHRLWAHRAYKAKWPLRVILMLFNTLAFQVRAIQLNLLQLLYTIIDDITRCAILRSCCDYCTWYNFNVNPNVLMMCLYALIFFSYL